MKSVKNALILFIVASMACSSVPPEPQVDPTDTNPVGNGNNGTDDLTNTDYNILFVGNSLTYTNDLPYLVKLEAEERGITIGTTELAKPNYAIVDHIADGQVQGLIQSGDYDFVVIQQGPSSQSNGRQMLIDGGEDYKDLCEANGAKLCYFMVWPSLTYYSTFDGVIANYTEAASLNDALLLPVGKVWKRHFDNTGEFDYYGADGFHPSLLGSQVAADVIVDTLF